MPTYPMGGPSVQVSVLLKQPRVIYRRLTSLTDKRYIADRIFAKGSPESVEGGVARFQRAESIYLDREAEEIATRSEFPRAGWSEAILAANVRDYGLEVPINGKAIRRNQTDTVQRGLIKLGNTVVKKVDQVAMSLIATDPDVLIFNGGNWSTGATIIDDLVDAMKLVRDQDEGYEPDTLIISETLNANMLKSDDIRNALPRESAANPVHTGRAAPILGLRQILVTPTLGATEAILLSSGIAGTIADETPAPEEGYRNYSPPGSAQSPMQLKMYEQEEHSDWIIRGARFCAMWIAEPKAIVRLTSLDA